MVKGVNRQIILVASPEPELFDQAIFILKEGAAGPGSRELLREAQRIAGEYLQGGEEGGREKHFLLSGPLPWLLLGAGAVGLLWLITGLI
ncbi:MAG: hypothetical protein IKX47_08135 [Oscillospiraceae bacterium]|nr:hypothetical protein [Oscillospiraceae bacterium]